jgi:hypothetical protein
MASKYPRPYRVQSYRVPTFRTQHQAYDFLAEYQSRGAIRRCTHVCVRPTGMGGWGDDYMLNCEKDSFEFVLMAPASGLGIGGASRGFNGCPAGCRLYQPRWRGTLKQWRSRYRPLIWFERQPPMVKVVLIALPFLVAAAYFGVLRDLATLVRAIGEVWHGK